MIKLFQLDRLWQEIKDDAIEGMDVCGQEGQAQRGPAVDYLEQWLCDYSQRKYSITMASCTDALRCCVEYQTLGKVNVPVAVPNYTFIATVNAVSNAGQTPAFVDVNDDYHIDINKIPKQAALIIAVDLFGLAQDYTALESLDIPLIMDCAQSIETFLDGRSSLSVGWASCVSFAPTKTIPTFGSGGAVLTDDADFAEWARRWRTHGKLSNKDQSITYGTNSMISSFEAVQILCGIVRHNEWRNQRQSIAEEYTASIQGPLITAPTTRGVHTWHKYVIKCQDGETRERFQSYMSEQGIETQRFYSPLPSEEQTYSGKDCTDLQNSHWLSERSVGIPCQHTLSDTEVFKIAEALKGFR